MKQRVERRLAAILAADVAGYSRLMGADEEGTLDRLKAHRRELVDPKIKEHRGRIVKTTGDGMLAEFPSVVDAVRCAVEIQRGMIDRNAEVPGDKRITFRIGVNLGDVIIDGDDIYGDGVNIAARLEALAEPGGICVARTVRNQIRDKLPYPFEDMGEQRVKNIARPVRVHAMSAAAVAPLPPVTARAPPRSRRRHASPRREAPDLSVVVLPFADLSSDPDQEYFVDAITDDLTTDLSRITGSFVIARTTAFTYKGKPVDVKQLGRDLGVRYVIEGSVRRLGDQVRINVQLIDAETSAHLWADRFETNRTNLTEAQSEITGRLAKTLNVELIEMASRRIERERVADPDARDLVMRAWARFGRGPYIAATVQEALPFFERALEKDPGSVGAKIGIAAMLVVNLLNGWRSNVEQDQARVEQLLLEVLERDPNNQSAHLNMGHLRRFQGRLAEAQIELETAIALGPNNTFAFRSLGSALMQMGRPEAAIPYIEKSIRLSPHDPFVAANYSRLGRSHLFLGHVDQAIDLLRKALAANPRASDDQLWLAGALGLRGDLDDAKAAIAAAIRIRPEVNSLAKMRANTTFAADPPYWALHEKTVEVGLRRAGFFEE
jgi:adenylate cyclase